MKLLSALTLAVLTSLPPVGAKDAPKHLFILSGQSNMAGLKPEISFTPTLEEALGKENVTVVKDAQGGQPIRRWFKGWEPSKGKGPEATGDLYDRLLSKVEPVVEKEDFATITFVWMQGERDAKEGHGEVYASSMRGLIDQLAKDLKRDHIHFVIGRISDFDMENKNYPHWTMVRDAQVAVAGKDPNGAWVDTDDLNDKPTKDGKGSRNDLHYTPDGYKTLGKRFAESALKLLRATPRQD